MTESVSKAATTAKSTPVPHAASGGVVAHDAEAPMPLIPLAGRLQSPGVQRRQPDTPIDRQRSALIELRRRAATQPSGVSHEPIRRAWANTDSDKTRTWEVDPSSTAPGGRYKRVQDMWVHERSGIKYIEVAGTLQKADGQERSLRARAAPAASAEKPKQARKWKPKDEPGVHKPPRHTGSEYKHAAMPATLTQTMAESRLEPGRNTTSARHLAISKSVEGHTRVPKPNNKDGSQSLKAHGTSRDHVLANSSIDALCRAMIRVLRATAAAERDDLFKVADTWIRSITGDKNKAQQQRYANASQRFRTTVLAKNNSGVKALVDQLGLADNNMVLGADADNEKAGHGADIPTYRGRIAPFASRIIDATTSLNKILTSSGDRQIIHDALAPTIDTVNRTRVTSTTAIREEGEGIPLTEFGGDDINLETYKPSAVPAPTRQSMPAQTSAKDA